MSKAWWPTIAVGHVYMDHLFARPSYGVMKQMIGFTSSLLRPESVVADLSGGEKQGVAIARAMFFNADLIILDEPTVGLSLSEAQKVLDFVGHFKDNGKSCVFITHNIYHVYPIADRFVILDRGKNAGELAKKEVPLEELLNKLLSIARGGSIGDAEIHR
jgi:simple sugar transport system ATP-binding protein